MKKIIDLSKTKRKIKPEEVKNKLNAEDKNNIPHCFERLYQLLVARYRKIK